MKVQRFLNALEHARVHEAIKAAEAGTSGDIVVYITHQHVHEALAAAHEEFRKLRLDAAKDKNSLLIFVAPKLQTFALVGGMALHAKVGQPWWNDLRRGMARRFKEGRYTDGLVEALEQAGIALRTHFPATTVDRTGQRDIVEE